MKKYRFTYTKEFNHEKERQRILTAFSGAQQARQLEILDLFLAGDFAKTLEKYNDLPMDDDDCFSEKEDVSIFISDVLDSLCYGEVEKIEEIK